MPEYSGDWANELTQAFQAPSPDGEDWASELTNAFSQPEEKSWLQKISDFGSELEEKTHVLQGPLQTPGAFLGAKIGRTLMPESFKSAYIRNISGEHPNFTEGDPRADIMKAKGLSKDAEGNFVEGQPLPNQAHLTADVERMIPSVGETFLESVMPENPKWLEGHPAIKPWYTTTKRGGELLGAIVTDPLTYVGGAGLATKGGKSMKLLSSGRLGKATETLLRGHPLDATAELLSSPLMVAAYGPTLAVGIGSGLKGSISAAGKAYDQAIKEGDYSGAWDSLNEAGASLALTLGFSYLGKKGLEGMASELKEVKEVRPKVKAYDKWMDSPERQKLYDQIEATSPQTKLTLEQVDGIFEGKLDVLASGLIRAKGEVPEFLKDLRVEAAKELPLNPEAEGTLLGSSESRAIQKVADSLYQESSRQLSPLGFYSQLEHVVEKIPQAMSGRDMLHYLSGPKRGVKAEELKWVGLDDFLAGKAKVTPKEVQDFIAQNKVEVKEVTKGVLTPQERGAELLPRSSGRAPKFATYQEPGGQNYRELLLLLPEKGGGNPEIVAMRLFGKSSKELTGDQYSQVVAALRSTDFTTSHFNEPNVLAHVRFNERTDAQGKKVLFIEELQSDWAQKGRRKGFKSPGDPVQRNYASWADERGMSDVEVKATWQTDDPRYREWRDEQDEAFKATGKVPSAPFVGKTEAWTELALKRMVRWAAENGFDKLAWTKGEQQAQRYSGATQLKPFYDTLIPAIARKIGKKWGAKVGETEFDVTGMGEKQRGTGLQTGQFSAWGRDEVPHTFGTLEEAMAYAERHGGDFDKQSAFKAHSLDITPEMRRSVVEEGQPLFQESLPRNPELEALAGEADKAISGSPEVLAAVEKLILPKPSDVRLYRQEGGGGSKEGGNFWTTNPGEASSYSVGRGGLKYVDVPLSWVEAKNVELGRDPSLRGEFILDPQHIERAKEVPLLQQTPGRGTKKVKGLYDRPQNLIQLFEKADFSTIVHELTHAFRPALPDLVHTSTWKKLEKWLGVEEGLWTREAEEKLARAEEKFLYTGNAPLPGLSSVFQKMSAWMHGVYSEAQARSLPMSKAARDAFGQIYGAPKTPSYGKGVGLTLGRIRDQKEPTLSLDYKDRVSPNVVKTLEEVFSKIFTESGEVAIPGTGTIHERLKYLEERGITTDEISDMTGGKWSPQDVSDAFFGLTGGGQALEKASKIQAAASRLERELTEKALNDPEVKRFLENYGEPLPKAAKNVLFLRKMLEVAQTASDSTRSLVRALLAGTAQVAVFNGLNSMTHMGLWGATTSLRLMEAGVRGDMSGVLKQWRQLKEFPTAFASSTANLLGESLDKLKSPLSVLERSGHTPHAKYIVDLVSEFGSPEHAKGLLHKGDADMPTGSGMTNFEKFKAWGLDLNLMVDRWARLTMLQSFVSPILDKYKTSWDKLGELAKGDPAIAKDLANALDLGTQLAYRGSGGFQAPRNSLSSKIVDALEAIPFGWALHPMATFPRMAFANLIPVTLESFPLVNLLSKRAKDSLITYPSQRAELERSRVNLSQLKSDILLMDRGSRKWRGKKVKLTESELNRYQKLVNEDVDPKMLKMSALLTKKQILTLEKNLNVMKRSGLYEPGFVKAQMFVGPLLISAFALWRLQQGEDDTEYNQVRKDDKTIINTDPYLGPWKIYALMGDMWGHKLIGSKKYDTPDGFVKFKNYYEALTSERYGQQKLSDIFDRPEASYDYVLRSIQSASSNVGRMFGAGAWPLDVARRVEEHFDPEAGIRRRPDASTPESASEAVMMGLINGFGAEIPGLRERYPASIDWSKGEPARRIGPLESIVPTLFVGDDFGKTVAGNLLGRREEPSKVALFMNRNQGFVNPSNVFPKRTDQPEFDMRVAEKWKGFLREIVEPSLPSLESYPQEIKMELFTNLMQRARAQAEFLAEVETLGKGGTLPKSLQDSAQTSLERGVYGRMGYPIPKVRKPKGFSYLLLPPSPEEDVP